MLQPILQHSTSTATLEFSGAAKTFAVFVEVVNVLATEIDKFNDTPAAALNL